MILVLLGTQNNSFHRLLEKIDDLINKKIIKEEVIVQAGYTKYETKNMKILDFVSSTQLEKLQKEARIIITHGGVGSIITSLKLGKKVISVPRLHEYAEHVNNHQTQIVELFSKKGYIIGVLNLDDMEKALKEIETFEPKKYEKDNRKMLKLIEDFIDKV